MQEGFNTWKGRKCIRASFSGRSTQDFHTEWTGTDCFWTRAEIPTEPLEEEAQMALQSSTRPTFYT